MGLQEVLKTQATLQQHIINMQFSKITILLTAAVMYAAGVSASCQQIKCDKTCGSGGAKKNFCGSVQCNDLNVGRITCCDDVRCTQ
ncbi:EC28 protein [Colletotrichum asianum]